MRKVLTKDFFDRSAVDVARDLLGVYLVRRIGGREYAHRIVETEAYEGPHDKASHAYRGRTKRTEVMFGDPGVWYVYLVYGMHEMLNVVTGPEGHPAAVLIRGAGKFPGPGKLTKALGVSRAHNKKPITPKTGLWFEYRGEKLKAKDIVRAPRIGVHYAGPVWSIKPYRFIIKRYENTKY